jgi:hypothetical protein
MVMKNVGRPWNNTSCTKTAKEYMAYCCKVLANSKPKKPCLKLQLGQESGLLPTLLSLEFMMYLMISQVRSTPIKNSSEVIWKRGHLCIIFAIKGGTCSLRVTVDGRRW